MGAELLSRLSRALWPHSGLQNFRLAQRTQRPPQSEAFLQSPRLGRNGGSEDATRRLANQGRGRPDFGATRQIRKNGSQWPSSWLAAEVVQMTAYCRHRRTCRDLLAVTGRIRCPAGMCPVHKLAALKSARSCRRPTSGTHLNVEPMSFADMLRHFKSDPSGMSRRMRCVRPLLTRRAKPFAEGIPAGASRPNRPLDRPAPLRADTRQTWQSARHVPTRSWVKGSSEPFT